MSSEGDKDNNNSQPHNVQPSHTQNLLPQNLSFSINDILSNNHDVNDSSFQSIVQTLSNDNNNEHITPSYAHLPAELQDLFNSNETDDLLSEQGGSAADASILQGDMWSQTPIDSSLTHSFMPTSTPSSNIQLTPSPTTTSANQTSSTHSISSSPSTAPPLQTAPLLQQNTPIMAPSQQSTPIMQQSTPLLQQAPSQQSTPLLQPNLQPQIPSNQSKESTPTQPNSMTLLDNITSQLAPDKKEKFIQLFRQLQTHSVSPNDFLSKAKQLLGKQQYQQLEDLKNKPGDKRPLPSSQIRAEDAQRSMSGISAPQIKRAKTEHIPVNTIPYQQQTLQQQQYFFQLQQQQLRMMQPQSPSKPLATPIFKTPTMPTPATGLQVPSKSNAPPSSKPPTATGAATTASAAGTGGGDRIDYETLTDVMGYAGVDLKEETEHFMKDGDGVSGSLPDGIDRSRAQDFMNVDMLRDKILKHAKGVNIKEIDSDYVSYMALATQDRIRNVIEAMVHASKHRTYDPLKKTGQYKIQVKQNVKYQLEAIERVERHVELDMDPSDDEEMNEEGWYSKYSKRPLLPKKEGARKVTVQDAIFVMERDVQGGRGTSRKTLLKALNSYLS